MVFINDYFDTTNVLYKPQTGSNIVFAPGTLTLTGTMTRVYMPQRNQAIRLILTPSGTWETTVGGVQCTLDASGNLTLGLDSLAIPSYTHAQMRISLYQTRDLVAVSLIFNNNVYTLAQKASVSEAEVVFGAGVYRSIRVDTLKKPVMLCVMGSMLARSVFNDIDAHYYNSDIIPVLFAGINVDITDIILTQVPRVSALLTDSVQFIVMNIFEESLFAPFGETQSVNNIDLLFTSLETTTRLGTNVPLETPGLSAKIHAINNRIQSRVHAVDYANMVIDKTTGLLTAHNNALLLKQIKAVVDNADNFHVVRDHFSSFQADITQARLGQIDTQNTITFDDSTTQLLRTNNNSFQCNLTSNQLSIICDRLSALNMVLTPTESTFGTVIADDCTIDSTRFKTNTQNGPLLNAFSDGTRLLLKANQSPVTSNLAIGIDGNDTLWCDTMNGIDLYHNAVQYGRLGQSSNFLSTSMTLRTATNTSFLHMSNNSNSGYGYRWSSSTNAVVLTELASGGNTQLLSCSSTDIRPQVPLRFNDATVTIGVGNQFTVNAQKGIFQIPFRQSTQYPILFTFSNNYIIAGSLVFLQNMSQTNQGVVFSFQTRVFNVQAGTCQIYFDITSGSDWSEDPYFAFLIT